MQTNNSIQKSFLSSLGILVWIGIVAYIMQNGDKIFGQMDNIFLGPVTILLLFVVSAVIVGYLMAGQAIFMYIDGKKKEAINHILYTCGFTALYLVILLGYFIVR